MQQCYLEGYYTPRIRGSAFAKTRSNARTALAASMASSTRMTAPPSFPSTAVTSGSSNSTATPAATPRSRRRGRRQGGRDSESGNPDQLARGDLRAEPGLLAGLARQRQHIFVAEELPPPA